MLGIKPEGWLTIAAIITGPILALVIQRALDHYRERHKRQLNIFKELMATRAPSARVSPRHVDALNAIEIEFSSGKGAEKKVAEAWRLYLDHLADMSVDANNADAVNHWADKGNDLFVDLLYEMSGALHYSFDKVWLKKNIYYPKAQGEFDSDSYVLRKMFLEYFSGKRAMWAGIFTGDRPIQMEITNLPKPTPPPVDVPRVRAPEDK